VESEDRLVIVVRRVLKEKRGNVETKVIREKGENEGRWEIKGKKESEVLLDFLVFRESLEFVESQVFEDHRVQSV